MFGIGPVEMMFVGIIGLLLFGSRLPEVAKSLGKGMREFKDGVSGVSDEFHSAYSMTPSTSSNYSGARTITHRPEPDDDEDADDFSAPKFDPPPLQEAGEPTGQEGPP